MCFGNQACLEFDLSHAWRDANFSTGIISRNPRKFLDWLQVCILNIAAWESFFPPKLLHCYESIVLRDNTEYLG